MSAGGTGTLANFFVEIASKGVEQTNKEIDQLGVGLQKDEQQTQSLAKAFAATFPTAGVQAAGAAAAVGSLGTSMGTLTSMTIAAGRGIVSTFATVATASRSMTEQISQGMQRAGGFVGVFSRGIAGLKGTAENTGAGIGKAFVSMGSMAAGAFVGIISGVQGLIRAGLQGTVEGEQLNWAWMQLGRELAGVFKPIIDAVIKSLTDVVRWFRSLSGEQQKALFQFVALAGGIAMVATGIGVIPGLALIAVSSFGGITAALEKLSKGFLVTAGAVTIAAGALLAFTGVGIAAGAAAVATGTAMLGLAAALPKGGFKPAGAAKEGDKGREGLTPAPGGFEEITASYKRIQQAGAKMGTGGETEEKKKEREEADRKKKIDDLLRLGERILGKLGFVVPNNQQGTT